jgi:hypothetical protein
MPYQPTNPYPYNTAINLHDGLQFRFKIDDYDVIESFEIEIYDYYKHEKLYTIFRTVGDISENTIVEGDKQLLEIKDASDNQLLLKVMEITEDMIENNSVLPIKGGYNQVNIGKLELSQYVADIQLMEKYKYYCNTDDIANLSITDSQFFEIDDRGFVTKYTGTDDIVVVPYSLLYKDEEKGTEIYKTVVGIASEFQSPNVKITRIVIPTTVLTLGTECFKDMSALLTVSFNRGIKVLGESCFEGCMNLININLLDSIQEIGSCAFYNCEKLTQVWFPSNLTKIGDYAFCSTGLTSLVLPESLTSISEQCFSDCDELQYVEFNSKLQEIGVSAFEFCRKLKNVDYSNCNSLETIKEKAFTGCDSLQQIDCSNCNSLTTIEADAFAGCSLLSTVVLPDTVETISSCFGNCVGLTHLTLPKIPTVLGELFSDTPNDKMLEVLQETKDGDKTYYIPKVLETVTLTNCEDISYGAFSNCVDILQIDLPDNLETISDYAFYNCVKLQGINIPESVTSIGASAFALANKKTLTIEGSE